MLRRAFLRNLFGGLFVGAVFYLLKTVPSFIMKRRFLRPPGAIAEKEFLEQCTGCSQCANVCPNKCISMFGLEDGLENLVTPRINARARACTLCMACNQVCPTNALKKLEPTKEGMRLANMGKAFLMEDVCYSYAGRTCGACYRSCPLPGEAMTIGLFEQPKVNYDLCVGCGLCEQSCVHMPQAIRIIPAAELVTLKDNNGKI